MYPSSSRKLPLLLPLIFACSSDAPVGQFRAAPKGKHDVKVQSVWKEVSDTPGKQTLAILEDDMFTHSEHFLMFGKKEGKLSVRDFVANFIIIDQPGHVETSQDNFYKFTATFITKDKLQVKLKGQNGSKHELLYERVNDDQLVADAVGAADTFYEKFDKIVDSKVKTLSDLKALVRLHQRSHDFGPNDDRALDWQFEIEELQIEGMVDLSAAKKKLAGVDIKEDGSDAISKHFKERFGKDWTSDADLPEAEEAVAGFAEDEESPFFLQFHQGIDGVEEGPLRDGLKKFAKFTITTPEPFECEDFFFYVHSYFWVLSDGSILEYLTTPECD